MLIGVPKEIKADEYRVAITPPVVSELVASGHKVAVETYAGQGSGIQDPEYEAAGARIAATAEEIFETAELIVKVKEPLAPERKRLRRGQVLFTYLHLAADPEQTRGLMESGVTAIAYESVTGADGRLPLLLPMSRIAGFMAPQVAAHLLERPYGGRGVLVGIPADAPSARVVILGGGTVGQSAARMALGMGAEVTVVARRAKTVELLSHSFSGRVRAVQSSPEVIEELCLSADAVIGAVAVPGGIAPKLVSERIVKEMMEGAVIVDVCIDQGGCAETSRPTSHSQPSYMTHGVVHYCVPNMPGAVPRTSTFALSNATRPFILALANKGLHRALEEDVHLRNGLAIHDGKLTCRPVANALSLPYTPAEEAIALKPA